MRGACLGALFVAALALTGARHAAQASGTVRFHHLHFRTANVTAALAEAVRVHGGSRVLLQGLGVGVRAGDHYLLFDIRGAVDGSAAAAEGARSQDVFHERDLVGRYRAAARWLTARGIEVNPPDLSLSKLASSAPDETLDHIAFAAANLDAVVETLRAAGATEARRTAEAVLFRAEGALVELTRDTDLPDVLWCPMHPDVRAPAPGKCPVCAMDLVPIPPPRIGQYRVDVAPVPAANKRGVSGLSFRIRDPRSGEPVTTFAALHERLFHLFIIGRDLRFFAHEHPVQKGEAFDLELNLAPGAYMLIADFLPAGGSPQMVHRALVTPGFTASPFAAASDLTEDLAEKTVDGLRVRLTLDPSANRLEAVLRFRFTDVTSDLPIANLQPYLGASGHLLIVNADLTHAIHAHPEGVTAGPDVNFGAEFPGAGLYKLWVQVQRDGRVFTAPFVVRVGAR